jgi:hypothetical protein
MKLRKAVNAGVPTFLRHLESKTPSTFDGENKLYRTNKKTFYNQQIYLQVLLFTE